MKPSDFLRYFCHTFWRDCVSDRDAERFWTSEAASPTDKLNFYQACVYLSHYVLGDTRADEKTIDAMVWAISRYGHSVLGVEPRLDIRSHLLYAARNELSLHVLKPFYRDHFFHAIEVCFLGQLLLETKIRRRWTLGRLLQYQLGMKSEREVLREWYVAALFHDVGYAMEVLRRGGKAHEFFKRSKKLRELSDNVESLLQDLSKSFVEDDFEGFTKDDDPGRDHGVVAAVHLRGLIEHIRERRPGMHDYSAALRAIAMHNHQKRIVDFENEPLSFLLILCDTIQEWNRPHVRYSTAPATILSRLTHEPVSGETVDLTGPLERVGMNLEWNGEQFEMKDRSLLEFELGYSPDINRDAKVFNLWLDSSSNLQRLRMSDTLPFNIKLNYITPAYITRTGNPELQMHRLMEAAEQTHMNFLTSWFPREPTASGAKNDAIAYEVREPAGPNGTREEILTIDLRALGRKTLITASIDTFRKKLSDWKRFNEDREFAGDYAPSVPG